MKWKPGEFANYKQFARRFAGDSQYDWGMHGRKVSGVISYADVEANLSGFEFYQDVFDSWNGSYTFSFGGHLTNHGRKISMLNEYENPNKYSDLAPQPTGPRRE